MVKFAVTWYGKVVTAVSVAIYDSFAGFEAIHITSHPQNETQIIWEDDPRYETDS